MKDFEHESDEELFIVKGGSKKIRSQPGNPDIKTLYDRYKDGDLIIDPLFQRRFVWNKKKASSLIESILLNIPLPIIFTAEVGYKEEVIDGQQRLTSIFSFMDGIFPDGSPFKLSRKLKVLGDEIGGKTFKELEKHNQMAIKKYPLSVVSISEDSQEDIKFEMFERLNTNITSLNAQELRNCLFRGPYNEFLKIMAKDENFQYIINKPTYKRRMQDVELVSMFCCFYNIGPDHYNKSLSQMLNDDMKDNANFSKEKLDKLENQFKKSVKLVKHIFGNSAFNIYSIDPDSNLLKKANVFNQGLYQILMYWFTPYETNQIIPYADLIKEELLNLQIHNEDFRDTLTGSGTNSPRKVKMKYDIWGNTIKGILNYPQNEPRAFSYSLKKQLWEEDQTCQICSQQISTIDDAEVDHIICYWKGGKTIPENARLTHRLCNRKRSGN